MDLNHTIDGSDQKNVKTKGSELVLRSPFFTQYHVSGKREKQIIM